MRKDDHANSPTCARRSRLASLFRGVLWGWVLICVGGLAASTYHGRWRKRAAATRTPLERKRPQIERRLRDADREREEAVQNSITMVHNFFAGLRKKDTLYGKGIPFLVDDILSWRGKWAYLKSKAPVCGDKQAMQRFLNEQFSKRLFSPQDLDAILRQAVEEYQRRMHGIDNRMLVDIETDLGDIPPRMMPFDDKAFRARFIHAMKTVVPIVRKDMAASAGAVAGSLIAVPLAERVIAAAATRLGISGGLLGAGSASSEVSLGAGLVIAVAADWVVGKLMDWVWKPREKITRATSAMLDQMEAAIIRGKEPGTGLRAELLKQGREHNRRVNAAVKHILYPARPRPPAGTGHGTEE